MCFSGVFLVLRGPVPEAPQLEVWTAAATSACLTAAEFFHEIFWNTGCFNRDPYNGLNLIPKYHWVVESPKKKKKKKKNETTKASFIAFFRYSVHPPPKEDSSYHQDDRLIGHEPTDSFTNKPTDSFGLGVVDPKDWILYPTEVIQSPNWKKKRSKPQNKKQRKVQLFISIPKKNHCEKICTPQKKGLF